LFAGHLDRQAELIENLLRQLRRVFGIDAAGQDDELVPAEAGDGVAAAQDAFQPGADGLQQFVADGMTQGVVDDLEAVEIEEKQQAALLAAQGMFDGIGQAVVEQQAVG